MSSSRVKGLTIVFRKEDSGFLRHVNWYRDIKVSGEHTASFFKVADNGGNRVLWNICMCLSNNTA